MITSDYNKFASKTLETEIKKGLVNNSNISYLVKNSDSNTKIEIFGKKAELKAEHDKKCDASSF